MTQLNEHSLYVLKNSGLLILKPDSPFLQKVYSAPLIRPVIFKSMVADWHRKLVTNADNRLKEVSLRILASGFDVVIMLFLGRQNDWVIGCAEQRKLPQGFNSMPQKSFEYKAAHGKYFIPNYPLRDNRKRMKDGELYREIINYFK